MSPFAIIIHLDVFKDFYFGFVPGLELHPVDQFDFERVYKTLSDSVVPTIALLAHAPDELILRQQYAKSFPAY